MTACDPKQTEIGPLTIDVTICHGAVVDAVELAEFAARTFEETYSAENKPEDMRAHVEANFSPSQQAAELSDPSVTTILSRSSGKLVAYAQVRLSMPPSCVTHAAPVELHRLYVDRRAHGSGLASKLIQAVHQAAHEFEGRHIWLSVWEQNARAISFYKKVDFVDVGSTIFLVGPDKQVDRVLVTDVCRQGPGTS